MQIPEWNKSLVGKCQLANDIHMTICSALELSTIRAHGQDAVATLKFKMLRRHQLGHFLPAFKNSASTRNPPTPSRPGNTTTSPTSSVALTSIT